MGEVTRVISNMTVQELLDQLKNECPSFDVVMQDVNCENYETLIVRTVGCEVIIDIVKD